MIKTNINEKTREIFYEKMYSNLVRNVHTMTDKDALVLHDLPGFVTIRNDLWIWLNHEIFKG